jgi:16S rRNA (uracil1498-N3)-methyltransferase
MRLTRLFVNNPLDLGKSLILPLETAHYILNVLRLKVDTPVILFNGQGGEYLATIVHYSKRQVEVMIQEYHAIERESSLCLTLVQALSRPERMDLTIQKAVELGVQQIVPVLTERSITLNHSQISKREQHWQKIIASACEQCGRNRLPQLHSVVPLSEWLTKTVTMAENFLLLSPRGKSHFVDIVQSNQPITVLVGSEGGFSEMEIQQAISMGYKEIALGERILRTETAAIAIVAICQALHGDLLSVGV